MHAAPDALPFVDRHEVLVAAPPRVVWDALPSALPGGAAVPGFRVAEATPERRVRLTGRHHFSRYALTFTLRPAAGGTMLSADTDAVFPGVLGGLYRVAVIGTGAHGLLVPRMLRSVKARAERRAG